MESVLYVRLPCQRIYPAGPVYLADHVHKEHPSVRQRIIDLAGVDPAEERKLMLEAIDDFGPDLILFSWRDIQPFSPDESDGALENSFRFYYSNSPLEKLSASITGMRMVLFYENRIRKNLALIRAAKNHAPAARMMVGGPAFSVFAHILIKKMPVDTVGVIGEGEQVLSKTIAGRDVLDERVVQKSANGVVKGKPVAGKAKQSYLDLAKATPIDFDYIAEIFPEFSSYLDGYVGVQTKRGCPYSCLFCLYNYIDGKKVRYRPPSVVASEVEALNKRFGVTKIWFCDSQFFPAPGSLPIAEATLDEIINRNLDIQWTSYLRIDLITREIARKMIRSGISDFELSITSGSQAVIDRLKLGFKLERFLESCKILKQEGFSEGTVRLNLSLNAPGETRETILETVDTVRRISEILGPENVQPFLFFLAVQPGTGLAELAVRDGYLPEGFNPLALNPFIIRRLIYNPPPLGKLIGQAVNKAKQNGAQVGPVVLRQLEEQLR